MRSRGWVYTLWTDKIAERIGGDAAAYIQERIGESDTLMYAIGGAELTPKTNRRHIQGYCYFENGITRNGFESRFGLEKGEYWADPQRGTHQKADDYSKKDGEICVSLGMIPTDENTATSAWSYILDMVKEGCTDAQIMREYPAQYGRCSTGIAKMRMELLSEKINTWRDVNVCYIYGSTGAGKTRGVLEGQHHPSDVYRVTDYANPFDNYRGQKYLLLEEFRSSMTITDILVYLDGYYCELPCRYSNKVANWETVYIVTNIPITDQYKKLQQMQPASYAAFLRRVHTQMHMGHLKGNIEPLEEVNQQLTRLGIDTNEYQKQQETGVYGTWT